VQHLDHRCETVGRAARVRDDVVLGGLVFAVVHAEHEGDVLVGRGRGDDDLLYGAAKVRLGLFGVGKEAGGLNHNLRPDRGPVQLGRIAFSEDLDFLPIDRDEIGSVGDLVLQVAEDGVVLEEWRGW
jgi:hypothetical protein